jgi:branched-chain amino acid transport system substrate-binding protein
MLTVCKTMAELHVTENPPQASKSAKKIPLIISIVLSVLILAGAPCALLFLKREQFGAKSPYSLRPARDDFKDMGKRHFAEGRYAEAIEEFSNSITRNPQDGQTHILREDAGLLLAKAPTFKAGLLLPLSSYGWEAGYFACQGAAMAQEEINARGGIKGKKLNLLLRDDRSTNLFAIKEIEKLIKDREVCAVIGPLSPRQVLAIAPLIEAPDAGLPIISPTASSPRIFEQNAPIFSVAGTFHGEITALACYAAKKRGCHRIAALYDENDDFCLETMEFFEKAARREGTDYTFLIPYAQNTKDFERHIGRIRELRADGVFFSGYNDMQLLRFMSLLHKQGLKIPVFAPSILASWRLTQDKGESLEDLAFAGYFFPSGNDPSIEAFLQRFEAKFRVSWPSQVTVETYNAVNLLASSLESRGSSRDSLASHLRQIGTTLPPFKGIEGEIVPSRKSEMKKAFIFQQSCGRYSLIEGAEEDSHN